MGLIEKGKVYQDMYMRTMSRLTYLMDKELKEIGTNEKTYLPLDWRWYCNFMTTVEEPLLLLREQNPLHNVKTTSSRRNIRRWYGSSIDIKEVERRVKELNSRGTGNRL